MLELIQLNLYHQVLKYEQHQNILLLTIFFILIGNQNKIDIFRKWPEKGGSSIGKILRFVPVKGVRLFNRYLLLNPHNK